MTWTDVTSPPVLLLPTHPLERAAAAIDQARTELLKAQDLEWVSVAADQYRAELSELDIGLSRLAQAVMTCQDEWTYARTAAYNWGQL